MSDDNRNMIEEGKTFAIKAKTIYELSRHDVIMRKAREVSFRSVQQRSVSLLNSFRVLWQTLLNAIQFEFYSPLYIFRE